jgi:hypothetical protein
MECVDVYLLAIYIFFLPLHSIMLCVSIVYIYNDAVCKMANGNMFMIKLSFAQTYKSPFRSSCHQQEPQHPKEPQNDNDGIWNMVSGERLLPAGEIQPGDLH